MATKKRGKPKYTKWTPNKEKFSICMGLEGMSQSDAYRSAYNCKKMTDKTIWEAASRIYADSKVLARVEELRSELVSKALWTAEKSVKVLSEIAENKTNETFIDRETGEETDISSKHVDRISAVKELNAMHGFKSDTVIDMKSSDGSMSPKEMTDEQLDERIDYLNRKLKDE